MKTQKSRIISMVLVLATILALSTAALPTFADGFTMLRQNQDQYAEISYNGGSLYRTGCGVFALVNAVGALTGRQMDVKEVADWAYEIGALNKNGPEGSYRGVLYPNAVVKFGEKYGFTGNAKNSKSEYGTYSNSWSQQLREHIQSGGVAIGHVPSHFIAIVGYDSGSNKYHIYDSYPTQSRGTAPSGDCWKTASELNSGKLCLDWFYLISATGSTSNGSGRTVADGTYVLRSALGDFAIDCTGGYTWEGAQAILYETHGGANQQVDITYVGNGYYRLTFHHSGLVFDVCGNNGQGSEIIQYSWQGSTNQLWRILSNGDGSYRFESASGNNLVLDVCGGSAYNCAAIIVWPWSGDSNQRFYLATASSSKYFSPCPSSCKTITAGLQSIGQDSSYDYRKQIAEVNGISGYRGTATQNELMLQYLKEGRLIMP